MKVPIGKITSRDSKQLGIAMAHFRKQNKRTQAQLAELAGVLQKTVSTVEREGSGTQPTLFKFSRHSNLNWS